MSDAASSSRRAYRVEPDWNVTKANDDRLHADDGGIAAECLRIFNFRLTNRGDSCQRRSPSWVVWLVAESRFPVGWPGGWVGRGRREPIHGAWPRHPCRGHPALPTLPAADRFLVPAATHGEEKEDQKQRQPGWPLFCCRAEPALGFASWPESSRAWARLYTSKRSARPAFAVLILLRGWPRTETVRGRAGWVRGTVGAMDGAIEPHGWVYGVSREPIPPGPIA